MVILWPAKDGLVWLNWLESNNGLILAFYQTFLTIENISNAYLKIQLRCLSVSQ